jgi:hypothetical protein
VEDTLYYNKGNHNFKFGADLLHNDDFINTLNGSSGSSGTVGPEGVYAYSYIGNYLTDLATKGKAGTCNSNSEPAATAAVPAVGTYQCFGTSGYYQTFGNPVFDITTLDYGAFAQDNWKVAPRLTVELGVRYDYESLPTPPASLANSAIPQTANRPSDKNNIGPRIGFSFDAFGNGQTVVRRIRHILWPHQQRYDMEHLDSDGLGKRTVYDGVFAGGRSGWLADGYLTGVPIQPYRWFGSDTWHFLLRLELPESPGA